MKAPLFLALVAGAAAGTGGGLLAGLLLADEPAEPLSALDPSSEDLSAEIGRLRDQNRTLAQRLADLEARQAMAAPGRAPVRAAPQVDLEELRDFVASLKVPGKPLPAGFQGAVERAIEAKVEHDRTERDERRRVEREQRLDRQIAELVEKLGLDPGQGKTMRDILADRDLRREEMFTALREEAAGMDRNSVRDQFRELTETTQTRIQAILTPQQYEQYQELGDGGRGAFPGRFLDGGDRGRRRDRGNRGD